MVKKGKRIITLKIRMIMAHDHPRDKLENLTNSVS